MIVAFSNFSGVMYRGLRPLTFSQRMTKDGGAEYSILFPLNEREILKEVV